MKKILLAALAVGTVAVANAQTTENWKRSSAIGISFTMTDYLTAQRIRSTSLNSVLANKQQARFREMSPGLAISYFKGVSNHVDFVASTAGTFVRVDLPNRPAANDKFLWETDASGQFKMFPERFAVNPYLSAGVGVSLYDNQLGAFLPLGGGVKVNLFDEASVSINAQYRVPATTESVAHHFFYGFGVSGSVGRKKEEEPKPAPPAPVDTDGDGILDESDRCPTQAGVAKYNGCPVPDTDKDGINDEQDKCPNEAGVPKYEGCPVPDTDKDGINDEQDKCPTQAGVAKYNGCPVPDTDNDGVNDEQDRCPTLPGVASNEGCPEVKQEVVNRVNYAAKNIFFVTGSAKLTSKSYKGLNEVAKIMADDANLKLSIEGHTDNVGKAEFNKTLSEKRAESVRAYLVSKGVDESRLTAQGFGLEQPVADNKTAAGRAQNRRVVMKLDY